MGSNFNYLFGGFGRSGTGFEYGLSGVSLFGVTGGCLSGSLTGGLDGGVGFDGSEGLGVQYGRSSILNLLMVLNILVNKKYK
jgi:hypothetical protein